MNTQVMFSHATGEWDTPQDFFDRLDAEFHFTLDAAAQTHNKKCPLYFGPDHRHEFMRDALHPKALWTGVVWCNPPYSMAKEFVAKAAASHASTIVMLLPARTDTKWFHSYLYDASSNGWRPGVEVRFLPGRLKFGGQTNSAPFPSLLAIWRS